MTLFHSLAAVPELRALTTLADGPATCAEVADRLGIDVVDAEQRLETLRRGGRVHTVDAAGATLFVPDDRSRSIGTSLRQIGQKLFGRDDVDDATWTAWLATKDLDDSVVQVVAQGLGRRPQETPPELQALGPLLDGALTIHELAAAMSVTPERAGAMLEWCRNAGLVREQPALLGEQFARYRLTRRGREIAREPSSLTPGTVTALRARHDDFASVWEESARRRNRLERGPVKWMRLAIAMIMGADGLLRVVFLHDVPIGLLLIAGGFLFFGLARTPRSISGPTP